MSPKQQRWGQVEDLFNRALDLSPEDRAAWLDAACEGDAELRGEVLSLLESDAAARGSSLGAKVLSAVRAFDRESSMLGRQVGPWRLERELGSGGMGTVFLAVRADRQDESRVAVKLVRPGLDTDFIMRRFRRERQILARLDHPNITRLFDGGTTGDGIPYLVMEFVDGLWITRHADERRMSLEERIRLCLPVCAAVDYAHRNFIVHRDLKPANIMIDRNGVAKLLDFGISTLLQARATDPSITQGVGPLTPDYASPEQILGEPVTGSSDVYSMGAVLYELLAGVGPHRIDKCTPLALERAICLDTVAAPSAAVKDRGLSKRLKGDLDNIVMRALQKAPERRYPSMAEFAADLQRFLDRRPVAAREDGIGYRVTRFVQRNRMAVALTSLAAAAAIGSATVVVREAGIAQRRYNDVRKLATSFLFDVDEASRDLPGSMPVRQLISRTGLEYLNDLSRGSAGDWDLKRELAAAYLRIGAVQGGSDTANLGQPAAALQSFASAGRLLDEVLHHSPSDRKASLDRMRAYYESSEVRRQMGQAKAAREEADAGLRVGRALLARGDADPAAVRQVALLHLDMARLLQLGFEPDRALEEASAGRGLLRQVADANPQDKEAQLALTESYARLGAIEAETGRRDEALKAYRGGAAVLDELARLYPNDTRVRRASMFAWGHTGDTLGGPDFDNAGDVAGAFQAYGRMAEAAAFLYQADRSDIRAAGDYGIALLRLGAVTPPAGPLQRETLERSRELLNHAAARNPKNSYLAGAGIWVETELGALYLRAGDRDAGIRHYRTAIAVGEKVLASFERGSEDDWPLQRRLALAARGLAEDQARTGARADAVATIEHAVRMGNRAAHGYGAARAWQAAGSVYALLAAGERGPQKKEDQSVARGWYQRAVDEWQALDQQRRILPVDRGEMEGAMRVLATGGLEGKGGIRK